MDHVQLYEDFWVDLQRACPELETLIRKRIPVTWGCEEVTGPPTRNDERLSAVETKLADRTSYNTVRNHPGPGNDVMAGVDRDWATNPLWSATRYLVNRLRETLLVPGIGDVVYYTSAGGEEIVRGAVYDQVLDGMGDLREQEVRLHLVGHSLGVTIAHDFLYGLFAPGNTRPGFIFDNNVDATLQNRFFDARQAAQDGRLTLGSITSMASQLPLFVLRVPALIERFYANGSYGIDPADIGIGPTGGVKWQLFYDVDDPLAFCTRDLYASKDGIHEFQVDCGDDLRTTHSNYWLNMTVIAKTAELIAANC